MGFAIAAEAARRGAEVTLVAGPTAIAPPAVGTIVRVRGALEMHHAVIDSVSGIDVVIMAAAVADYMPAERAAQKVSKTADTLTLVLTKTPDILGDLGARRLASGEGPLLVGFAAETEDVVPRATAKRREKHADLIVANDVSRADAGFDVGTNAVTLVSADRTETLPLQSKAQIAAALLDRVEAMMSKRPARAASPK